MENRLNLKILKKKMNEIILKILKIVIVIISKNLKK